MAGVSINRPCNQPYPHFNSETPLVRHSSLAARRRPDVFHPVFSTRCFPPDVFRLMFSVHVNRPLIPDESLENQGSILLLRIRRFTSRRSTSLNSPFYGPIVFASQRSLNTYFKTWIPRKRLWTACEISANFFSETVSLGFAFL